VTSLTDLPTEELLSRCLGSTDGGPWEEFVRRFQRQIARVISRTAAHHGATSPALIDDLVQETYLKLCADNCRVLRRFVPQSADSFIGYISVVAANVARDHFKSQLAGKRSGFSMPVDSETPEIRARESDPGGPAFMERSILLKEIQDQLDASKGEHDYERNVLIFWLYYRVGLTASAIASLPEVGLGEKGVESTILRMTRLVRDRIISKASSPPRITGREGFRSAGSF
jgi:RNA polymerase sigma-70 factor (ECF subfamily)